jgi:hypothetical protein
MRRNFAKIIFKDKLRFLSNMKSRLANFPLQEHPNALLEGGTPK